MTAEEARERVGEVRGFLSHAMRAVCVPVLDWDGFRTSALTAYFSLQDVLCEVESEGRGSGHVVIPPVRCLANVEASKAQALKPLEEAAEAFAGWQTWRACEGRSLSDYARDRLVDECCDVITATCNLLASLGVTDLTGAMAACEERNRKRRRYE